MCTDTMFWILALVIAGAYQTQAAWLHCYKGSLDNYIQTPLDEPLVILGTSCLDPALPTVVYTFGYRGKADGPATRAVLGAYINTRKRNVILVDWEEEASSGLLGIPLGYALSAVPNAIKIGKELGFTLMLLTAAGVDKSSLHLVGHSLGAHLMGHAGRRAREGGLVIPRITGLDPARALFEGTFATAGLDRACARFVDVVHSDPGGYGTARPGGTVDLWPNYAGGGAAQPGCPRGSFEMFSREDLCSHDRSWQYFAEAIESPLEFPAVRAANYEGWLARSGNNRTVYIGELTNPRARGNYFLTTNAAPRYGRGAAGLSPDYDRGRRRRHTSPLARLLQLLR